MAEAKSVPVLFLSDSIVLPGMVVPIESLKNNTGTDLASAIAPPKFSQIDSTLGCDVLFPAVTTQSGDAGLRPGRYS